MKFYSLCTTLPTGLFLWLGFFIPARISPQQFNSSLALAQTSPEEIEQQCQIAALEAVSTIEDGRNVQVVDVIGIDLSSGYVGYPANAPMGAIIRLDGSATSDVLSSPQFMATVSSQIITQCQPVSLIEFQMNYTGWAEIYGLVDDSVVAFKCMEADTDANRAPWGQRFCL
ncbi:MAG: hypothetical protein F6J95_003565 [Leptolyngbya sp. SIO1E4]|nr:hypothetical protein [Leptolyngbya sp. SIO1E4]